MGTAAACALAVGLAAGCSSGASPQGVKTPEASASASSHSAAATAEETPATPEEDFDAMALGSSFYFDGQGTGTASEAMKRYCDLLGDSEINGVPPAQWLAENELVKEDGPDVLQYGVDEFCPDRAKTLEAAVAGTYERWITDGTYEVGSGADEVRPGTYRTTGALRDCYWERTSKAGEPLDNQFATSAQRVTVTVRSGDGQFTSRSCGSWRPVK